nr:septum formation initiator family protein [Aquibacillus sediminis]
MMKKDKNVARIKSNYMQQYDVYMERQLNKKKRLYRRLALFFIIVLVTIGSLTTYHVKQRALHAEKLEQYEHLEEELASLKQEEKDLKQEVELLNDEEYILQIAKTNYFFSEEGEVIFKLPEEEQSY